MRTESHSGYYLTKQVVARYSSSMSDIQTCVKCGEIKTADSFSFRDKKENTRRKDCKECAKAWARENYARNPKARETIRRSSAKLVERNLKYAREQLTHCMDCGVQDTRVLEFDHVREGKTDGVMQRARAGVSLEVLQSEIDLCEVRCLNCHRIQTILRAGWVY